MSFKKRILVIGAGASGLTGIKSCKEIGFDVTCYEKSTNFGGIWRYNETSSPGCPSVLKTTITNTSKEMNAFSDFPPPSQFPTFMPCDVMLKYFELYAIHFDLLPCIQYSHEVIDVSPADDYPSTGKWRVQTKDSEHEENKDEIFDGVMICTGHHSFPALPQYPNQDLFTGEIFHSHMYKNSEKFQDKIVLVIGAGSSGADLAAEASSVAKKTYWSMKRPVWVYPRYVQKGKPIDIILSRRFNSKKPSFMVEKEVRKLLNSNMDHERFGIHPRENVTSQHPTINDEIKLQLANGNIIVKKNVREFTEKGVKFEGEDEVIEIDVVVLATGYNIKFPFLNEDILEVSSGNKVFLYKSMFPPQLEHPSLAIVGLVQPNGSLFPVFEIQTRWFAALMAGICKLPSCDNMIADVQKVEDFRRKHYVQTSRHSIEVNKIDYMDFIASQIKAKPNMAAMMFRDPKLFWMCFFGPALSYQYRLNGPFKWEGARYAILNYKSRVYCHMLNKPEENLEKNKKGEEKN